MTTSRSRFSVIPAVVLLVAYSLAADLDFSLPMGPAQDLDVKPLPLFLGLAFLLHSGRTRGRSNGVTSRLTLWGRGVETALLVTIVLVVSGALLGLAVGYPPGSGSVLSRLAFRSLEVALLLHLLDRLGLLSASPGRTS
jgi:hypothetical protein